MGKPRKKPEPEDEEEPKTYEVWCRETREVIYRVKAHTKEDAQMKASDWDEDSVEWSNECIDMDWLDNKTREVNS